MTRWWAADAARGGHNGMLKAGSEWDRENQFALEAKQCQLLGRNWTRAGGRVDWTDTLPFADDASLRKLIK